MASNTYKPLSSKTGTDFVTEVEANYDLATLGTKSFRDKCVLNEAYWKNNCWTEEKRVENEPQPNNPTLFAMIENTLADIMDNYPECAIRATKVSKETQVMVVNECVKSGLERINFRNKYAKNKRNNLKRGLSVFQMLWDKSVDNGFGDIDIINIDPKNFFWDTTANSMADARFVGVVSVNHDSYFAVRYPEKFKKMLLGGTKLEKKYDNSETQKQSKDAEVGTKTLDYYWTEEVLSATGIIKTVVHYAKVAGGVELERDDNLYDFGYPFIVIPCYELEDTLAGVGMIDIFKDEADYINRLDQFIFKNAWRASRPKILKQKDSGIDSDEYMDGEQEMVEGDEIHENAIREVVTAPLPYAIMRHYENKQGRIKEYSAQNDFSTGNTANGVVSGKAIVALQGAGAKRLRLLIDQYYTYFTDLIRLYVFFMAKYYDDTRLVRISKTAAEEYAKKVGKDKAGKAKKVDGITVVNNLDTDETELEIDFKEFKIEGINANYDMQCVAQKHTPDTSAARNEIAIRMREIGATDPLETVKIMEFEGKEEIETMIEKRMDVEGTMLRMQQVIEQQAEQIEKMGGALQQQEQAQPQSTEEGDKILEKINSL